MLLVIQEVVKFIDRSKRKGYQVQLNKMSEKQQLVYRYLINTKLVDENELIDQYFKLIKYNSYQKFLQRLLSKLVDIVSASPMHEEINLELSFAERSLKYQKLLTLAKGLGQKQMIKTALFYTKKVIIAAEKYGYIDLLIEAYRLMTAIHGSVLQNYKLYSHYRSKYKAAINSYIEETEFEQLNNGLMCFHAAKKKADKNEILNLVPDINIYINKTNDIKSFRYGYFLYQVIITYYYIHQDYESMIKYADRAINLVEGSENIDRRIKDVFLRKKFTAVVSNQDYVESLKLLSTFEDQMAIKGANWFVVKMYKAIIKCHLGEFFEANEIIAELLKAKKAVSSVSGLLEYLNLIHGYLYIIIPYADNNLDKIELKKFQIFKFLNDVPRFSRDKEGVHVQILVLQIMYLIEQRKFNQIVDRVDALRQYSYRYLKKDESFRSNCFIKMILEMVKADFNPIRTQRYVAPLYKRLKAHPLKLSEQTLELEIIPYEALWPFIIKLLEKKKN